MSNASRQFSLALPQKPPQPALGEPRVAGGDDVLARAVGLLDRVDERLVALGDERVDRPAGAGARGAAGAVEVLLGRLREVELHDVGDAERAERSAERRADGGAVGGVERGADGERRADDDAVVDAERGAERERSADGARDGGADGAADGAAVARAVVRADGVAERGAERGLEREGGADADADGRRERAADGGGGGDPAGDGQSALRQGGRGRLG